MAKFASPTFIDGAFNTIKANASAINYRLTSAQPTTLAEASSFALASTTLNKATEITLANGDTSGRKMTISAKAGIAVSASGTATHVSIDDGTTLLFVTTTTPQAVSAGGTVDIGSWKDEIAAAA